MGLKKQTGHLPPLSWRLAAPVRWAEGYAVPAPCITDVIVVCSKGHGSSLKHWVEADGRIVAPPGMAPSIHCGTCGEVIEPKLDGWAHGAWRGFDGNACNQAVADALASEAARRAVGKGTPK